MMPDAFLTPSTEAWLPVADGILKSTLLLLVTAVSAVALRRVSAATRHCVWTLGLLGALALPALSLALPRWEMPVVRIEAPAGSGAEANAGRAASAAPDFGSAPQPPVRGTAASVPASQVASTDAGAGPQRPARSWPPVLAFVWLLGALAILGRLGAGLAAVHWMSRRSTRVIDAAWLPVARELAREVGVRPTVTFRRSTRASMPMAWGIFRASVLMPADADRWPADRLRIVLLHELAHVKRRDCLTHALSQIACAVYWFNPLVWIAARHLRIERERACDDLVLAAGTRGADYADQLLAIARAMRGDRFPALLTGATLAMAHRTQLEGRLIAILDPGLPRSGVSRLRTASAAAVVACAVLPLATLQPWAYAEPQRSPVQVGRAIPPAQAAADSPAPREIPQPRPSPMPQAAAVPIDWSAALMARGAAAGIAQQAAQGLLQAIVQGAAQGAVQGAQGALAIQPDQDKPESTRAKADPRTVAALTAALKDSDEEVREAAMHALVQLRDPSIFEPLVAALRDASVDVREQAAFALGQMRDRRAIAPLTAALKDQSASVREQVVFALGQLRDEASGGAFAQALKDESASVREQAAFALGQLRDPAFLDALAAALKDSSASVREQAAFALGQLRDRRALQVLTGALADSSASVREQAVFALGQLGDPAAIDSLVIALRDAKPDIREQAAFALGQIRDGRAVAPLLAALKDADPEVRHNAAFALGQLGDRAAVEALVIAIKDPNAEVRAQVAFALGQLRDPRAIDALTSALKDASAEVRQQAAFALGQLAR